MAFQHLKGLILILIILWFVWFFFGGPQRDTKNDPFIKPAAPIDSGQTYGPQ